MIHVHQQPQRLLRASLARISRSSIAATIAPSATPQRRHFARPAEPLKKKKNALVMGSSGALGSVVAQYFMQHLGMDVLGADVAPELPSEWTNDTWELTQFCPLNATEGTVTALTQSLLQGVHQFVHESDESDPPTKRWLDVIVVASGGWEMDPPLVSLQKENPPNLNAILEHASNYLQTMERMRQKNFDPVLAASVVAQNYLNHRNRNDPQHASFNGSLMVVLGATAALQPTPGMLAYGWTKHAAHFVIETLGASTGGGAGVGGDVSNLQDSKLVRQAGRQVRQRVPAWDDLTVLGLLPTTLDTPSNRRTLLAGVPKDEQAQVLATWIAPERIAREIGTWMATPALRPHSGALIKVMAQLAADATADAKFELVR
jgi:dihydropteridine reductase